MDLYTWVSPFGHSKLPLLAPQAVQEVLPLVELPVLEPRGRREEAQKSAVAVYRRNQVVEEHQELVAGQVHRYAAVDVA